MKVAMDYWVGQLLSLIFYVMTLIVYNRVRKAYVGGKIAAAINLIIVFLFILLLNDFVDYFLILLIPLRADNVLIIKILLKLMAICVLFFGGLRFFTVGVRREPPDDDIAFVEAVNGKTFRAGDDIQGTVRGETPAPGATVRLPDAAVGRLPTLGRYEIIEQIGRGAMGVVYKGRDPRLNRLTAVKTIRFIDDYDEEAAQRVKERFYREAETVARLTHRNIVTIYDVGEDLDLSYLAMEYLEGETLEQYVAQRGILPPAECVEIVRQVCDALDYAHRHGVVHRDIKPGNIMMLKNGLVKVTDFGVARAAGGMKTRTGVIKGTPYYMSPEQATGKRISGASDIFSLGVVFYQLLTGRLPFSGDNLASIIYQTTHVEPEPPTVYNPDIAPDLLAVLNKALAKSPEHRYRSAHAMRADLQALKPAPAGTGGRTLPEDDGADPSPSGMDIMETDEVLAFSGVKTAGTRRDADRGAPTVDKAPDHNGRIVEDGFSGQDRESAFRDFEMMLDAGTQGADVHDAAATDSHKGAQPRALPHAAAVFSDQEDVRPPDPPPSHTGIPPAMDPAERGRRRPRRLLRRAASGVTVAAALLFGAHFFWFSPRADERLIRILYHRLVKPPAKDRAAMMAEQQARVQEIMKAKMMEKQRQAESQNARETSEAPPDAAALVASPPQDRLPQTPVETREPPSPSSAAEVESQAPLVEKPPVRSAPEKEKTAEKARRDAEAAAAADKEARRRAAQQKIREAETLRQIDAAEKQVDAAAALRDAKHYSAAREQYAAVLAAIERSANNNDPRMRKLKERIDRALSADDMIYGPKGYVFFEEQWLAPAAYQNILLQRGFVRYKEEWETQDALKPILRKMVKPVVEKYVSSLYSGQRVHTKNIRYQSVDLLRNSLQGAAFTVTYHWEVWTFKGRDQGVCAMEIQYDAPEDRWRLIKGCD